MASPKRTVLITGCSDGSLGSALAIAFHRAGFHVYATARNASKLQEVTAAGCSTLILDVSSDASIKAAVAQVPQLDILVNNAGGGYNMPIADVDIAEAKKIFDLNVWSVIAVTQAFLPLLIASKGTLVNHTSMTAVVGFPFQASYNASKAAISMYSTGMRQELAMFDIKVVEIRSGGVESNFTANVSSNTKHDILPQGSIYEPAKDIVNSTLRGEWVPSGPQTPAEEWAKLIVQDLTKASLPIITYRGLGAGTVRLLSAILPIWMVDRQVVKMTKLNEVEKVIRKQ